VVANLYICDALADGLDDTGTLVTEDNGERALGVLSGECVGIWRVLAGFPGSRSVLLGRDVWTGAELTGMADTGVVDLDADFIRLGWGNLDVLDGEILACFPGDCGLCPCQRRALELCSLWRHCDGCDSKILHPCHLEQCRAPRCCGSACQGCVGGGTMGWKLGGGASPTIDDR
jgi:hypothetical protein